VEFWVAGRATQQWRIYSFFARGFFMKISTLRLFKLFPGVMCHVSDRHERSPDNICNKDFEYKELNKRNGNGMH
jgi:hypothetical protein